MKWTSKWTSKSPSYQAQSRTKSTSRSLPDKRRDSKTGAPIVMNRKRSLYGLAQSPALSYGTIDTALLSIGFTPAAFDPVVYTYGRDDTWMIPTST